MRCEEIRISMIKIPSTLANTKQTTSKNSDIGRPLKMVGIESKASLASKKPGIEILFSKVFNLGPSPLVKYLHERRGAGLFQHRIVSIFFVIDSSPPNGAPLGIRGSQEIGGLDHGFVQVFL